MVAVVGCGRRGRVVDGCVHMDSAALEGHRAARRRDLVMVVVVMVVVMMVMVVVVGIIRVVAHSGFGGRMDPA